MPRCRITNDKHTWISLRKFPAWDRCSSCGAEFRQVSIGHARVAPTVRR